MTTRLAPAYQPPGGSFAWTSLVGLALRAHLRNRISLLSNLDHWRTNSAGIQRAQLRNLLLAAAKTSFGKRHDFSRLARLDNDQLLPAYQSAVPVADWLAFREPIASMREEGTPDVLWPGLVRDFAQTSGTTAGDKFIPVSRHMLRSNFLASLDIFAHLHRLGVSLPSLCAGKSLFLGGSTNLSVNKHGIRTGDLSGIVTPLIRWPVSSIYLPGPQIALMSDWPAKINAMAQLCLRHDVRMISGMCSWALVLFEKLLELAHAQGRHARTLQDLWPNLTVFVHGGVKYAPFDPRVRQAWSGSPDGDDLPRRLELYPASEAFLAIQDQPASTSLRLNVDHMNFFEFVPLEDINNPAPRALACDQVELGQRYVVVLSTCAGLWRYILGDVVEFDSVPAPLNAPRSAGQGPARLRIVGRHRLFINAFGENLIVEHIENAVAHAARDTSTVVGEFTAAPVYPTQGSRPGLELLVELQNPSADTAPFALAFDHALKQQNIDYTTKRTQGLGMQPPTITPLPFGTIHRWMQSRGKLGGQHKCPRCANSRDWADQLHAFLHP